MEDLTGNIIQSSMRDSYIIYADYSWISSGKFPVG
ncbi:Protein of unknown function [Anaplasma phagocytophilum]|uniref:Uncharacterized protein n=1 Tax=Anaplasma phagocytophilum TaxID=948 RepID=A0A098EF80_ANAPH|nr:Protein of unknown function [Anaplasma phagocytophilum]